MSRYDESKHVRDRQGRYADKPGSGASGAAPVGFGTAIPLAYTDEPEVMQPGSERYKHAAMNGQCLAYAVATAKRRGFKHLVGGWEERGEGRELVLTHVFAYDRKNKRLYDVRGSGSIKAVSKQYEIMQKIPLRKAEKFERKLPQQQYEFAEAHVATEDYSE